MEESSALIDPKNEKTPEENNELSSAIMSIKNKEKQNKVGHCTYTTSQQEVTSQRRTKYGCSISE